MKKTSSLFTVRSVLIGAIALLAILDAGIFLHGMSNAEAADKTAAAAAPPAIPVSVQTITAQNIRVWSSYSGRMQAVDYALIKPEVSGRITDIRFKDGQDVKAGEILMVIDPQPYEAAVAKAEANIAAARTKADFARTEVERAENLVRTKAIAQRLYDERANDNRVALATIKVAEAELKQAKIDVDHAYVKAPISGRVSRAEITLGNLVQTGPNAPLLTSIVSNNGIYADFEVDEQTYMRSIRAHGLTRDEEQAIPVQLNVQGDEEHVYNGTIYSFDNHIDPGTGTIRARAKFSNEDGSLMPGMFVSIKLAGNQGENVLLVAERAVGNDQSKKFVYVVSNDSKVVYREVNLGKPTGDGQRIVLSGLQAGERVIVDGLQHVRPDAVVQVKEASLASDLQNKVAAN